MSAGQSAREILHHTIARECSRDVPQAVREFAQMFAARSAARPLGIIFYGSALRDGALDGVLDFYVLVDSLRGWHGSSLVAAANSVLPPNVEYHEFVAGDVRLRAKIAVLTGAQFARRCRARSLDTSLWARFSQPVAIIWARDDAARARIETHLGEAVIAAAHWAARLGPDRGKADAYWRALYARTYGAELRVERTGRADVLLDFAAPRYAALLEPAWDAGGIVYTRDDDGTLHSHLSGSGRIRWALRRGIGKLLNLARLVKAAFTFTGGADYIAWKIERHSQVKLNLSDWQRRHPVMAAPRIAWRLWRQGTLR